MTYQPAGMARAFAASRRCMGIRTLRGRRCLRWQVHFWASAFDAAHAWPEAIVHLDVCTPPAAGAFVCVHPSVAHSAHFGALHGPLWTTKFERARFGVCLRSGCWQNFHMMAMQGDPNHFICTYQCTACQQQLAACLDWHRTASLDPAQSAAALSVSCHMLPSCGRWCALGAH